MISNSSGGEMEMCELPYFNNGGSASVLLTLDSTVIIIINANGIVHLLRVKHAHKSFHGLSDMTYLG